MRLEGKVAIVTGGANGIGYATVTRFLEEGASVVIADYAKEAGEEVVKTLDPKRVQFIEVDVSNRESVKAMVQKTVDQFGRIDILINNAGITRDAMLTKMTETDFQEVLNVNLNGVFHCTQEVALHMVANQYGKIINTTSVSGVYGNVGQTNYAAAKAGIIGMTKSWAKELGRKGINVNAVAPGFTLTEMVKKMPKEIIEKMTATIPLQRMGKPEDIANAYLFLASEEASYVHGHVLHVDGAIMM
ncbi:3-oxoacyl-ACP reductase FabG [Viridibacillus arvi]|uniref:3-oxoacyl-ACP reductase FabG n=1 Tax=Viridibacillus arvi TaxID=263475 RepID=UPI00187B30F0|nr:3-oxoacyl-ACP reductase FabG [Viridibacillus sp. JNUCC-6]QOV11708.1 3-oxoacyl-ACP reductase FabG [Viridibacillus sp. JNUCC-6]